MPSNPSTPARSTRHRRQRRLAWGALALTAILAASCGDSSKSEEAEAAPVATSGIDAEPPPSTRDSVSPAPPQVILPDDACDLFTVEEAEELAGRDMQEPESLGAGTDVLACLYPTHVTGPLAQVELFVGPGAYKILEIDRDTLGHEFTEVPGIGDEALQQDGMIFFRTDDLWAGLRLTRLDVDPEEPERLQHLARIIADRLRGAS